MDVRLARPTDAPIVLSLALDEGAHLVRNPSWPAKNPVPRTLARALMPVAPGGRAWISRAARSTGLLEIQPRPYVIGWDIGRLVARGELDAVMGPLLGAAIGTLQSKGVPRLFARCGEPAGDALQKYGFQSLARERVLLGSAGVDGGPSDLPLDSRYRIPADAWPLHQLETAITPPLVRQIEGLTSVEWSRSPRDMSEIVVERDGRIVAWCGWGRRDGPRLIRVALMTEREHADAASDLVRHALKQVPPGHRVVAQVRDYQVEAIRAFLEAGFQTVAEEVLLVKHAGVELARAERRRLQVAPIPTVPGLNVRVVPRARQGSPAPLCTA